MIWGTNSALSDTEREQNILELARSQLADGMAEPGIVAPWAHYFGGVAMPTARLGAHGDSLEVSIPRSHLTRSTLEKIEDLTGLPISELTRDNARGAATTGSAWLLVQDAKRQRAHRSDPVVVIRSLAAHYLSRRGGGRRILWSDRPRRLTDAFTFLASEVPRFDFPGDRVAHYRLIRRIEDEYGALTAKLTA